MQRRLGEIPFAGLTVALAAGIVAADCVRDCHFFTLAAGQSLLSIAALCAYSRKRPVAAFALAHLAVALAGWLIASAGLKGHAQSSLQYQLSHDQFPLNEVIFIEGCVAEEARTSASATLTTVELHGYRRKEEWIRCRGTVQVRVAVSADVPPDSVKELKRGDRILAWATMRPLVGYENPGSQDRPEQLRRRGILLFAQVKSPRLVEVLPSRCGSPLDRAASCLRARLRQRLESLRSRAPREAAILSCILLGDSAWLDPATRETFQNSGTYHVLVVSGLHVAWIAWATTAGLKALRLPALLVRVFCALLIPSYALLVGFQASVSRALWMYALYAAGQLLYRRGHPANIALSAAFLLLSWRPNWLYETGFQLSFVSVLAIALAALPIQEEVLRPVLQPLLHTGEPETLSVTAGKPSRMGRRLRIEAELLAEASGDIWGVRVEKILLACGHFLARMTLAVGGMVLVSVSVQVWLEPLLAYHFNRISWAAVIANILIVPLASAVLAAGAAGVCLTAVLPGAEAPLAAAVLLSRMLVELATHISDIPGAWMRCVTPCGFSVTGILLALFLWHVLDWKRKWVPCCAAIALLVLLTSASTPAQCLRSALRRHGLQTPLADASREEEAPSPNPCPSQWASLDRHSVHGPAGRPPGRLELTFLDVGQGDAVVIRFPDAGIWILDAGGTRFDAPEEGSVPRFDIGEAVVSRFLWHKWIGHLDQLIVSHPHMDHAGGIPALIRNFCAGGILCNGNGEEIVMRRILDAAAKRRVPVMTVNSGCSTRIGGVHVRVLGAPQDGERSSGNDSSLVLQLCFGRFSALLTGDIEKSSEAEITGRWHGTVRSVLLKVAHHGSRTSTSEMFLNEVRPRWAVISAGRSNPFGEPAREVVLRLARRGTLPLLTMDQGAITLSTDGERYRLGSFIGGDIESGTLPAPGEAGGPERMRRNWVDSRSPAAHDK